MNVVSNIEQDLSTIDGISKFYAALHMQYRAPHANRGTPPKARYPRRRVNSMKRFKSVTPRLSSRLFR